MALISHDSKIMLKILQAKLQQYIYHELPDCQAGFRKGRGTKDQIANIYWTSESSWFTYCWSLAWRILSIILLVCEMSTTVQKFEHSLGLEWKLTFSSPVDTAEFSKFAGILSAALSQAQLSGFEIAQLEFHPLP